MKKILVMVAVAMMTVLNVNAQEGYDDTKHEVAVSYGLWSNSDIFDFFEHVGEALAGASFENEKFFGPISAEYYYHVKNWIGVGAVCAYGESTEDVYDRYSSKTTRDAVYKNTYLTFMPSVKCDWLRKEHFGLYSKVALGVTFRNEKHDYDDPADKDTNESDTHMNWQFSFIGIEAGGSTLRGFSEFGIGEQGIVHVGLRYKF